VWTSSCRKKGFRDPGEMMMNRIGEMIRPLPEPSFELQVKDWVLMELTHFRTKGVAKKPAITI